MKHPDSRDPRKGGILAGLLITGVVLVCVTVAIVIAVVRNVHVRKDGENNVSIHTPAGDFDIHAHDGTVPVDIPIYPGAVRTHDSGGGATFEWSGNDGDNTAMSVAGDEFITQDSPEKVMAFYQDQDPNWILAKKRDGKIDLELRRNGYRRFVVIKPKSDGTHIGVASIGSPAAN